jgi:two-component system response regulator (stage 0 sporulation protein F)
MRATGQIVTVGRALGCPPFAFSGASTPARVAHHLPADARAMTKKILIVEDNDVVQGVLRQFFEPRFCVQIAGDASHALGLIVRSAPDVVLLDFRMPGLDGLSLLKSLREMGVTVPIFIMTGYDSLDIAQDVLSAGANGYLPKPFDLLHLDRLVADACGVAALEAAPVSGR